MGDWQFLLDENIDPKTASYLEKEGIHVEHVRDALWQGATDEDDVLPYAREHDLIIQKQPGNPRIHPWEEARRLRHQLAILHSS